MVKYPDALRTIGPEVDPANSCHVLFSPTLRFRAGPRSGPTAAVASRVGSIRTGLHDSSVVALGDHAPIICRNATTLPR